MVGFACGVHEKWIDVPSRWDPWAPLRIDETPNWLTSFKLHRLSGNAALCSAVLATSSLDYTALADKETGENCGWRNAVRISATPTQLSSAFTLSCSAAVSLAMWERHVLQPAAEQNFGQRVGRIEHLGSYACRDVRGGHASPSRRSEHASANALDVAGFRLADGRRIRIATDWAGTDADAIFLHQVHRGACGFFSGVLGPEYNSLHRDHFHLDRGPFHVCR